jgi:hypothetical protein
MASTFRTAVLQCETTFHIETQLYFNYNAGRVKGKPFRPPAAADRLKKGTRSRAERRTVMIC